MGGEILETKCNRKSDSMERQRGPHAYGLEGPTSGREDVADEGIRPNLLWQHSVLQLWRRGRAEIHFRDEQESEPDYRTFVYDCRGEDSAGKDASDFRRDSGVPRGTESPDFKEKANEHHVIAAGSLLGTLLAQPKSYLVGMVNLLDLYPLTFDEFLAATDEGLYQYYSEIKKEQPIEEIFHNRLEAYHCYLIIGGMPEIR